MKRLTTFCTVAIILFIISLLGQTSCVVLHRDNGNHKGWYKNSNNPHNPNTTNPGHTKGKSKGKSKK